MQPYKRLLVISHNCFSQSGSNGRTLANLIYGWPKEKIAQVYIHEEEPDFSVSEKYFCITDKAVLNSLIKRNTAGENVEKAHFDQKENSSIIQNRESSVKKDSFVFLLRNLAWDSTLWKRNKLYEWVDSFSPEIILVQAGDAAFLFKLAEKLSEREHSRLFIFNTEGYYFKSRSYLNESTTSRLFYPIVHSCFVKAYDSLVKKSETVVYSNECLMHDYSACHKKKSAVIMTSSGFADEDINEGKVYRFVYAGNLGLNRHRSLIELANVLYSVDQNVRLDVYGNAPTENIEKDLSECSSIVMHGFVPYKELQDILRKSQFLIHVESFDAFYQEDLKYAFSTKVADSLASGACFIVYAPENMAISQYLKGKNASVLINNPEDLHEKLSAILSNNKMIEEISKNGRSLAEKNHSMKRNRDAFQKILLS